MNKSIQFHGHTYCGEVNSEGLPDGQGKLVTGDKTFTGNFNSGRMDGQFTITDTENYSTTAVIRNGQVRYDRFEGTVERLQLPGGYYSGEVDEDLLPFGEGSFTYENGMVFRGCWNEVGVNGPYTLTTARGSVVEGTYQDGETNSYTKISFCNGDSLAGFVHTYQIDDGVEIIFELPIMDECHIQDERSCPDPDLEDYWYDYLNNAEDREALYEMTSLNITFRNLMTIIKYRPVRFGYLAFRTDGIYIKVYFHKNPDDYWKVSDYPYQIQNQKEASYMADIFYQMHHRRWYQPELTVLNDNGRPNEFEWINGEDVLYDILFKDLDT